VRRLETYKGKNKALIVSLGDVRCTEEEQHNDHALGDGKQIGLQLGEPLGDMLGVCNAMEQKVGCERTKVFKIILENAPRPPVGSAFVKEMRVVAQTMGSINASRTWYHFNEPSMTCYCQEAG
jgi:hypothetical protein